MHVPSQDFIPKLQDHLLQRLRTPGFATNSEEFPWHEREEIQFHTDRIFRHKVLRVNYTSYDIRRCQDSMNLRTQANIIVPAPDLDPNTGISPLGHPFAYAHILGVYHANIIYNVVGQRLSNHTMKFL